MFGSFCQQRQPDSVYDACFGSGPEASPWQHGAPPLWLWLTYMTHLVDVNVSYFALRMIRSAGVQFQRCQCNNTSHTYPDDGTAPWH